MSLKTVWIDTLYKVATGSRHVRNFFTPIGAIIYGLLIQFCCHCPLCGPNNRTQQHISQSV